MANEARDFEAFVRQIDSINIELSQSSDGVVTVCSSSEPLFCYDADTKEELAALVVDTLASYAKHFFHIEGLDIKTEDTPIEQAPLPIERSTPVSRLRPVFDLAA